MKTVKMSELKPGDIFTHEIKLHNREAFIVLNSPKNLKPEKKVLECKSRTTLMDTKKRIVGDVILLRHV